MIFPLGTFRCHCS